MKNKLQILNSFISEGITNPYSLLKVSFLTEDEIRKSLMPKQNVLWAYKCAESVQHLIEDQDLKDKVACCLSLVEKWLNNHESVAEKELANAAYAADACAAYAADACAAYAADAANAANAYAANAADACAADACAAHAAYAADACAAHAAYAADAYAAYAAANAAANANNRKEQKEKNLMFLIQVCTEK